MMQIKSFKTALIIATVVGVAFAAPKQDRFKTSNENIQSGEVGTETNGEPFSTLLRGDSFPSDFLYNDGSTVAPADDNCLGATDAEIPSESTSPDNGKDMKPENTTSEAPLPHQEESGNKFFDLVFAIPINILKSVNALLNQKQLLQAQQGGFTGDDVAVSEVENPGASMTMQTNYDAIFDIPNAVLGSIQNLLNFFIRG